MVENKLSHLYVDEKTVYNTTANCIRIQNVTDKVFHAFVSLTFVTDAGRPV
jgi:hypothetical protein